MAAQQQQWHGTLKGKTMMQKSVDEQQEQPKNNFVGNRVDGRDGGRFNKWEGSQSTFKGVKKPAVKVTAQCHCGKTMKYHCVIQCEDCWGKIVEEHEQAKAQQLKHEAAWKAAPASAAAAAAASGAPVLATAQGVINEIERTQQKFCSCGKLIRNKAYKTCWTCSQKDKQLKAVADQSTEKLFESLKAEVAQKQRELAKLQLKEADEAFEETERALVNKPWGEDAQSD